jgi:dTDP-4-amino-4,6-dideoxygalactose transaminase
VRIGVGEVRLSDQAKRNVNDALDNNRLSYGKFTKQFESEFARIHHRKFAAFVNSGTSALQISIAALKEKYGWKDGAEVLVPAVTFVASFNVVIQNGLVPVLVDVDPNFYDMDRDAVPPFAHPVAAIPVSLFGQPTAWPGMHGVKTVEDSCETMFVHRPTVADITCYSTYACHLINTGVGGLALTDDPDLAVLVRSLANHGRNGIYTGIDDALGQWETMSARFTFDRAGYSYRATELEAAIGCAELETYRENIAARRANAGVLTAQLQDLPLQLPKERVAGEHAYMMYPIVCLGDDRDALIQHLESNGIETRPMLPLTSQPYLKKLMGDDVEDRYPVAKWINQQGFYVGSHPYLTESDLAYMSDTFHAFFRG